MLSINTGQCKPAEKQRHRARHRPTEIVLDSETVERIRPCFADNDTMELCQRCAKESKATNVFPLCCSNVDAVQNWCTEYIYFGLD